VTNPIEPVPGVWYHPEVVGVELADRIKADLLRETRHAGAEILIDGERHPTPRLVSSYADSALRLVGMEDSRIWTEDLAELRDAVGAEVGETFNYALANLYRNQDDYTGWHSDKAHLHATDSAIAIVSFGDTRRLAVRSYETPEDVVTFDMAERSVVVMNLAVQASHEHTVLKEETPRGPRLSITLRNIVIEDSYLAAPSVM